MSTRRVKAVIEELCGHAFSASTIGQVDRGLDAALARFAQRPLEEAFAPSASPGNAGVHAGCGRFVRPTSWAARTSTRTCSVSSALIAANSGVVFTE